MQNLQMVQKQYLLLRKKNNMSIYKLDGAELLTPYNIDGDELSQVYDISGNPLLVGVFVVMTYNPQWWTKINSQLAMQEEILEKYNPNIIGFQEYSTNGSLPSVGSQALENYPYKYVSNHYNYNGIASKIQLTNVTNNQYTYHDDEYWQYQKGYFNFNGVTIAFYNTHLTWRYESQEGRRLQAEQLFADAQTEEYVIITGDFNSYAYNTSQTDYINIFKPFVDAGYNLANASPDAGFHGTYCGLAYPTSEADMEAPCDSIIVSGNIEIEEVIFDFTKFDYLDGNYVDHIPVVAKLQIN